MTAISQKINQLRAAGTDPGAPRTDEMPCRDGGTMQLFEDLTIFHHPGVGTFALETLIRDAYAQDGGIETSSLGYPTSDEQDDPDVMGGRLNTFQFGRITWDALRGTAVEHTDTSGPVEPVRPLMLSPLDDVTGRVLIELNVVPGMAQRAGGADRSFALPELMQARSGSLPGGNFQTGDWPERLREFEAHKVPIFLAWTSRPLSRVRHLRSETADPANEATFFADETAVTITDTLDVVLAWPGDVHPKLVAVSVPRSLLTAEQWPVLVYFHPLIGQAQHPEDDLDFYTKAENLRSLEDRQFYPYGWDFLYFNLWNYLIYARPGFNTAYSVGLNYQRFLARKAVVNVLPVLHPDDPIGLGDFMNPDRLLRILGEIKWHFTRQVRMTDDNTVAPDNFRLAIGAFSNANEKLAELISRTDSALCRECLREVYFFDPPIRQGDNCISRAMRWAGNDPDKHVRFYAQTAFPTFNRVVGSRAQVKYGRLVADPDNPNRSAALLDYRFWRSVATGPLLEQIKNSRNYGHYHSLIASGTLIDALSRSGFPDD